MFTCRHLLQLVLLTALLTGCSTAQNRPDRAAGTDQAQAPAAVDAATPRIRIGPPPDQGSASTIGSEGGAVPDDQQISAVAAPDGRMRADVQAFVQQLAAERGLPADRLASALAGARYSPTVARLIAPPPGRKISRSWITYRARVVEPKRIGWGVAFWQENADALNQAAQRFGVPPAIIVGIIGVETLYGRNMGSFRVLDALSTLAFDYPDPARPERAQMFRSQLADFLTLVMQGRLDLETLGSYAGAIGMPQFMPGSILRYALDGDGSGHIDLANHPRDAILSVGNFLVEHGWERGRPVFAPVVLPPDAGRLVDGGLAPTRTWPQLQAAGATVSPTAMTVADNGWQQGMLGVIDLPEEAAGTAEYRTATVNFFALTQYNHSYFYATSVADLAAAIQARMNAVAARPDQPDAPVQR
ncbi:lytic murein transglycosylase B [Bordetella bronchialis]|uniref:Lytic murein transglycosylase B n=1 Tax=Bordetella bronchialis TaxID=463025 RepID=A0A193FZ13_9BORD|nr:lytic murein transglycosylase B [Bordetella bronchialis]ANN67912.1 lytic murein transglycosylase B [Bordetella bronchialis]ANN73002.1 lytic murein transglycosylase B [Bordetella bronchialis]